MAVRIGTRLRADGGSQALAFSDLIIRLGIAAVIFGGQALADTAWTGAVSSDMSDLGNWDNGLPDPANGAMIINDVSVNVPVMTTDITLGGDLAIGTGSNTAGRLDQVSGTLATGAGAWAILGFNSGEPASAIYNLADTAGTGGSFTGYAQGTGSLTVGKLNIGWDAGTTSTVNVHTVGIITADEIEVGSTGGGPTSTFNIDSGTVNVAGNFEVGGNQWSPQGGESFFNMSDGSITTGGEFWGGANGTTTAVQTGGTITSGAWFVIGRDGNNVASYTLSGGSVTAATTTVGSFAVLGSFAGSQGTMTVSGGSFQTGGDRKMLIGEGGTGVLTISDTGSVLVNNNAGGDGFRLGVFGTGSGTVNLNGGTLEVAYIAKGAGSGSFNFDGGILRVASNHDGSNAFMSGLDTVTVLEGGAVIDTNGNAADVVIVQDLIDGGGGGGLTKNGFGTLSLSGANTFTGPTTITAGTLELAEGGSLAATSGITVEGFGTTLRLASSEPSLAPVVLNQGTLEGSGSLGGVTIDSSGLGSIANDSAGGGLNLESLAFEGSATASLTVAGGPAIAVSGAMSTNSSFGSVTVNAAATVWENGMNPLISYGSFNGTATDFFLSTVTGLTGRQSAVGLAIVDDSLALEVSGDNPVWSGANGGVWTTGTFGVVGPTPNWALAIAHTPTDFWTDDLVEFNDTVNIDGTVAPPTTTAVSIEGGAVSPRRTIFNNESLDYSLSTPDGSGIATGSLIKNGAGRLTIATPNSHTDGTILNAGTLEINAELALGAGSLEINGGTLANASGSPLTIATVGMQQFWNGDFAFAGQADGSGDLNLGNGGVTIGGDGDTRTVTVSAGSLTVGPITAATAGQGLTKAGDGTLVIDAAAISQIAGTLTVDAGTLAIGENDMLVGGLAGSGTIINGSGTTRWVYVSNETDQTFAGVLADGDGGGNLGLLKQGAGRLELTQASSLSDRVTVFGGTLAFAGDGSLPDSVDYWIEGTGALRLDRADRIGTNPVRITSNGAVDTTWSNRLELTGGLSLSNPITFSQRSNETAGIVNVSDDNTIAGPLTIVTGGSAARVRSDAGRLTLAAAITTTATSARNLWLEGEGAGTVSGTVRDNPNDANGRINLVKAGTGTWTISGPNTYTGTTTVSEGTLLVSGSIGSSSGTTVTGSGTIAGGGIVSTMTVEAAGTVSPGNGIGVLSTTGGVNWASGGNLNWQLTDAAGTAGGGWDLLSVIGSLSVTATAAEPFTVNLWTLSGTNPAVDGPAAGFDPTVAGSWTLVRTTSGFVDFSADAFQVVTAASNGTAGFANDLAGGSFQVETSGNDLNLIFTPGGVPSDIVIDVPSGSQTQAEAGYPLITAADSVTKTGSGTLVMDAANTYTGPTSVSAGTLTAATADALATTAVTVGSSGTLAVSSGTTMRSPAVTLDGGGLSAGSLVVDGSTGIGSLTINAGSLVGSPALTIGAGGEMTLAESARVTVAAGSLAVEEGAGGGLLDLGSGQVSIAAGGITAEDLRADIIAGRAGGSWTGQAGISSAAAAASGGTRVVGYVVAGDSSARVSFAAPGDIDLSGTVNVFDLVGIDAAGKYGSGLPAVWDEGDFNYDGLTNVFDLVNIDTAGAYGQGSYFPAGPTVAAGGLGQVAAVPEPAAGLLVAAASAALAIGFRRRCRTLG